jgi:hypothetical protein
MSEIEGDEKPFKVYGDGSSDSYRFLVFNKQLTLVCLPFSYQTQGLVHFPS